MTNKEAIEVLKLRRVKAGHEVLVDAIDAAIRALEFMDACTVKDAEAERAHCDGVANRASRECVGYVRGAVFDERAQARGEGYAERDAEINLRHSGELIRVLNANDGLAKAAAELQTKLANLRAAAGRMRAELESPHCPGRVGVSELINPKGQKLYAEFCAAIKESK